MGNDVNCEENFRIVYYDMGQGDCILIVCPNKKLVMIDCGSSKHIFENQEKIVKDIRCWSTDNKNTLDALILTHPDKDHYNHVLKLLGDVFFSPNHGGKRTRGTEYEKVKIKNVYYSEKEPKEVQFPLSTYLEGAVGQEIINSSFKTATINKVIINKENKPRIFTYKNEFKLVEGKESPIPDNRYTILDGTTKAGKKWSISIIAGHVQAKAKNSVKQHETSKESAKAKNTISLVTLLEIDGHKALFTGDATDDTEDFLLSEHCELISGIDFVHVPHHGSTTSSTEDFVQATQPKGVQVTVSNSETSYHLPKKGPINRWLEVVKRPGCPEFHFYDYWVKADKNVGDKELEKWRKDQSYKDHINEIEYGYYLQINEIDKDFTGCYRLKYRTSDCYMLYRKRIDEDLWETGATATDGGYIDWFLPYSFEDHMYE